MSIYLVSNGRRSQWDIPSQCMSGVTGCWQNRCFTICSITCIGSVERPRSSLVHGCSFSPWWVRSCTIMFTVISSCFPYLLHHFLGRRPHLLSVAGLVVLRLFFFCCSMKKLSSKRMYVWFWIQVDWLWMLMPLGAFLMEGPSALRHFYHSGSDWKSTWARISLPLDWPVPSYDTTSTSLGRAWIARMTQVRSVVLVNSVI